jgi:hypothetical protein
MDLSEKKRSIRKKGKRKGKLEINKRRKEVRTQGSKIRWNSKYVTESTSHWKDKELIHSLPLFLPAMSPQSSATLYGFLPLNPTHI